MKSFQATTTIQTAPETIWQIFTGLLLPIFGRALPDLTPTFRDFVAGLKKEAESR